MRDGGQFFGNDVAFYAGAAIAVEGTGSYARMGEIFGSGDVSVADSATLHVDQLIGFDDGDPSMTNYLSVDNGGLLLVGDAPLVEDVDQGLVLAASSYVVFDGQLVADTHAEGGLIIDTSKGASTNVTGDIYIAESGFFALDFVVPASEPVVVDGSIEFDGAFVVAGRAGSSDDLYKPLTLVVTDELVSLPQSVTIHSSADFATAITYDATTITATPAYFGDANLDGTVNLADFGILRSGFGLVGSTWVDGDFNQDGTINLADFGLLEPTSGRPHRRRWRCSTPGPLPCQSLRHLPRHWQPLASFCDARGVE